jgi:hypothetical protein
MLKQFAMPRQRHCHQKNLARDATIRRPTHSAIRRQQSSTGNINPHQSSAARWFAIRNQIRNAASFVATLPYLLPATRGEATLTLRDSNEAC